MAARKRAGRRPDVVLISMPFGNIFSPSMGLSLLKGGLTRAGISCRVRYFGLRFAQRIGRELYTSIADDRQPSIRELAGEWIFARALFDTTPEADDRYIADILRGRSGWVTRDVDPLPASVIRRLVKARDEVDAFLDRCVEDILEDRPALAGFTSVFQQHVPSLALARRLREAAPELVIVFGGSNCEGVMGAETVRQFPFVDAAVSGEADLVFPDLARAVLASVAQGFSPANVRETLSAIPGVHTRDNIKHQFQFGRFDHAPAVRDMDALPYPDFDDFFDEFNATGYSRAWQPRIFFETSRGCWWGEKKHCTFCGLNGLTMEFRSKSAARALEELTHLVTRHPGCDVQVVDNILDMRYFKDLLPELASRNLGVDLFYETKSNLKKDQIRLMRAAGIMEIQPGIESFGNGVLQLMRKGVTGLQNIQLLKWCKELGVRPYWNVLWGFPGEPPHEYAEMARVVPWLTHLTPPGGFGGLRLDRFSPNFFDAESLGFRDVAPLPSYGYVYPLAADAVANLAYHFTFRYADDRRVDDYIRPLIDQLRAWRRSEGTSDLFFADTGSSLVVCDLRPAARRFVTVLTGLDRALYLACDAVAEARQLAGLAAPSMSAEDIVLRLQPLCDAGLLARDGTKFLALAIPIGEYAPPAAVVRSFYARAAALAHRNGDGPPSLAKLGSASYGETGVHVRLESISEGVLQAKSGGRRAPVRRVRSSTLVSDQFVVRGTGELIIRFPVRSRPGLETRHRRRAYPPFQQEA